MGEDKGEGEKEKEYPLTLSLSRYAYGRSPLRQRGEGKYGKIN
jgi:hypothetical protein